MDKAGQTTIVLPPPARQIAGYDQAVFLLQSLLISQIFSPNEKLPTTYFYVSWT